MVGHPLAVLQVDKVLARTGRILMNPRSNDATSSAEVLQKACLVINPTSGVNGTDNQTQSAEIWASLRSAGIWAETVETRPDETATDLARRAASLGFDMVIAAGGDGTVSEVAKGLVNTQTSLGIIPLGTYNNMARNLGIPTDVAEACGVLARGRVRRIDVGMANGQHLFFEAAGVGVDAPLFPLGEKIKSGRWWTLKPFWDAFKLFWRSKPARIQCEFDRPVADAYERSLHSHAPERRQERYSKMSKQTVLLRAFLVVIANGRHYGSAFKISPSAVLDDGLLNVSVFRRFSKRELVRHFASIYLGRRRLDPKIDTFRVAELRLSAQRPLACHVDGVSIGSLPLEIKVLPRALAVIA